MLAYLLSGIAYGFAAAVMPGPLSMYLLSQAVHSGWRRAMPATFAPLISDAPIALLVLTILSQIPNRLLQYLHIFGGVFILYLAFRTLRSWRDFSTRQNLSLESSREQVLKAATLNWLNPNPYLGWSTFLGPEVIAGWRQSPACGISMILGFYVTMIAVMMIMVLMFSATRAIGQRTQQNLIGLAGVVLACMGIYQIWLGSPILNTKLLRNAWF